MPPKLALLVAIVLIVWFFLRERKSREPLSAALWLPLIWAVIIGSKPVSLWLAGGADPEMQIDYLEGSPLDRTVFFSLIAAGLLVLFLRRESWFNIVWNNKWVFGFYFYLAISVLWSDYSFVSFKRWVKDFGNVVMALVVLSEINPAAALKSVLVRCACILIPLSFVTAKYFPEIGRYYDRWSHTPYISGVAGDKNLLGMTLFVSGLFLFYMLLKSRKNQEEKTRLSPGILAFLLLMNVWLLMKAQSMTALLCAVSSAVVLFVLERYGAKRLVVYFMAAAILVVFASSALNLPGLMGRWLGRDATMTGRTEIWKNLLSEDMNPLVGTGFYSFWLGDRSEKLSRRYHYALNEAHNGYLELYLNSGIIGLVLLFGLLGSAIRARWIDLKKGIEGAAFHVSFLMGTILYNVTEATFNRLSIIWFTFLLIVVVYPRSQEEFEVQDAGFYPAAVHNHPSR